MDSLSHVQEIQKINKHNMKKVSSKSKLFFLSFSKLISNYFRTVIIVNVMLLEILKHFKD